MFIFVILATIYQYYYSILTLNSADRLVFFSSRRCLFSVRHRLVLLHWFVLLTYLLTSWCGVLFEKLTGVQLVKKFPAFHGTRRFITALTSVRHLSLSWASPIQSIYPHPISWRSVLILSIHLRLGLPSGLFPSGFPTKTLYTPLSSPIRHWFVHSPKLPDRPWSPLGLQFGSCWVPFTGLKRTERKFDHLSPSSAEIKIDRGYTSVPSVYFSPVFGWLFFLQITKHFVI